MGREENHVQKVEQRQSHSTTTMRSSLSAGATKRSEKCGLSFVVQVCTLDVGEQSMGNTHTSMHSLNAEKSGDLHLHPGTKVGFRQTASLVQALEMDIWLGFLFYAFLKTQC